MLAPPWGVVVMQIVMSLSLAVMLLAIGPHQALSALAGASTLVFPTAWQAWRSERLRSGVAIVAQGLLRFITTCALMTCYFVTVDVAPLGFFVGLIVAQAGFWVALVVTPQMQPADKDSTAAEAASNESS